MSLDKLADRSVNHTYDELVNDYSDLVTKIIPLQMAIIDKQEVVTKEYVLEMLENLIRYTRRCPYCDLKERELRATQSELNDAYCMLDNRDKENARLNAIVRDSNE